VQIHAGATRRRLITIVRAEVSVCEIGSIAEPRCPTVLADELGGKIYKMGLLAEVVHVDDELPRP